jgi:putative PEP-CTERM system histidine kinase
MNVVAAIGHALALAAFLGLAVVLLVGWRGRVVGLRLIGAVIATAVWAATILASARWRGVAPSWIVVVEQLRLGSWLIALAGLASSAGISRRGTAIATALAAVGVTLATLMALLGPGPFAPMTRQTLLLAAGVAMPLTGLVLLEQLYRNSHATGRHALRPLFIGVGGMFLFDLFMYSEAIMALAVSVEAWAVRGFVVAACAPAIALAARRNPDWSLDVFVSRHVVFYSMTFLVVGCYLVAMSTGGMLIARYGGQWGELAQLVFLAGAGVVLAILVASGVARGRLRVFLAKHFYRNKYDYRVEWLRFVRALEAEGDPTDARAAMIRAVAQIIGSHFGALWVRAEDDRRLLISTQWSDEGVRDSPLAGLDLGSEFIAFLEQRQWIVDLEEHRRAPDLYQNLRLPDSLAAPHDLQIFVPLMHGGRLVGLLGLGPPDEPFKMNYEDRDLLKTVGHHIGTHVAQLESDRRLTENRQFEAYSRLTAFLMHDLKNLVAQLSLVVANAEKHRRNPAFVDDAIDTIRNSTDRMTRLIAQLQRPELRTTERRTPVRPLLERVVTRKGGRAPLPTLDCPNGDLEVIADPERLAVSLEHVVGNAQDATPPNGTVSVRLARDADRVVIQVADSGCGMSAEFLRDRLFRPFDSTKGSQGMGIGAYQVRDYVNALGGEVAVTSAPGAGTIFSISLPIAAPGKET